MRTRAREGPGSGGGGGGARKGASLLFDGIRCSISEVVGAVIVEDRLLSPQQFPPPRALLSPSLSSSPNPPKPSYAPKCPLRKPSPPPKDLPAPLARFPTPWHPSRCRESSAAPLSSVCHRPRKRAVLLRSESLVTISRTSMIREDRAALIHAALLTTRSVTDRDGKIIIAVQVRLY